jgi:hypothetical protein
MKRKTYAVSIIFLLGFCGLLSIFLEGFYLPFKPCRPKTYPDGTKTSQQFSQSSSDTLDKVLEFYDKNLDVKPWPADTAQWRREQLGDFNYLYSCFAVDINKLTTETGCIYVSSIDTVVHIEGELMRSEGSNVACPRN